MIGFDEYLKRFRNQHPHPRVSEDFQIAELFKSFSNKRGLAFLEIYSTSIFPQYIKKGEGNYLLWDNHFWDLFNRFLYGLIYIQSDNADLNFSFDYFNSISTLYLINRYERVPALSYILSKHYAGSGYTIPAYNKCEYDPIADKLDKHGYGKTSRICKIYVFIHEQMHFIYRNQSKTRELDFLEISDLCRQIAAAEWPFEDRIMQESAQHLIKNSDLTFLEEVCCDVRAITETVGLLNEMHGGNRQKIIQDVFDSIRYVITFQNCMFQIERKWQFTYETIEKFSDDFIKHGKDEYNKKFDEQQVYTQNESQARANLILLLAQLVLKSELLPQADDFFESESFISFFQPTIEFMINGRVLDSVFEEYVYLKDKFSYEEFATAKKLNVGWY